METIRVRAHRRRSPLLRIMIVLCILLIAGAGGYLAWLRTLPNTESIVPDYGYAIPVMYEGAVLETEAKRDGEELMLPLDTIQELLGEDAAIHYEEGGEDSGGSVIMTTAGRVLHMKTEALTATMNSKPFELAIAAKKEGETVMLPLTPVQELYGMQAEIAANTGIVTLLKPGQSIPRAAALPIEGDEKSEDKWAAMRSEPSIHAPIVERIAADGVVRIWGEADGWYRVQSASGHLGYGAKSDYALAEVENVPEPKADEPFVAWKVLGSRINLTWEAVYNVPADPAKIGEMPGVNVVSPTWFELMDDQGTIKSKADPNYVTWAHGRGMQVWALFNNSFEPDRTTEVLNDYETRLKMSQQLLSYARMYKLQGINIDFENVHTKDKANLVQFVREFTPLAHDQGLVVSIDVTPKSNSEMWSAFLDRKSLGKIVDYMMVMTYDEHWASSPKAGSVASLPWVEQSVKRILEEDGVPARKLVLGIPLYTRIWVETKDENGKLKVSSKAYGMETIDKLIAERKLKPVFDEAAGQHYVEYEEDGARHRIWIEDETSIRARGELAKTYGLGGVATWQRGFQKPAIWQALHEALESRP
jgi:spore germination protein YaaH